MLRDLLVEAHEYCEAIIATVHEPMLILTKNLQVIAGNKSFYKKFKVYKQVNEGQSFFDLGNKQWDIKKLRNALSEILPKNSSFEDFEVTYTFAAIGEQIMLLDAHLIIQKTNKEQLILTAIEDITDRSLYYFKEKCSLSFIEANLDPLTTINNEGKLLI